jgi:hypothetical protein
MKGQKMSQESEQIARQAESYSYAMKQARVEADVPTITGPNWEGEFTTSCPKHAWGTYSGSVESCAVALFNHTVQYHSGEKVTYQR